MDGIFGNINLKSKQYIVQAFAMVYGRQGTKQPFFGHIHNIYLHIIIIHTDGTKHLTLLRIRTQGNNTCSRQSVTYNYFATDTWAFL